MDKIMFRAPKKMYLSEMIVKSAKTNEVKSVNMDETPVFKGITIHNLNDKREIMGERMRRDLKSYDV